MFDPQGPTLGELARQALSSTRGGYDLLAPKFERTPFRTPDWVLAAVAPHLGAPRSVRRAIDLACGTGAALPLLAPLCRELVAGTDFSLGMLAEAQRRWAARDASPSEAPVVLLQAELLLPCFAGAFELATIFGALGHVRPAEQPAFLAAVRALLAPGGRLVFVVGRTPPWSPWLYLAAGFDLAMWLRNRLWRPPFVMYYLAWPWRRTRRRLHEAGFAVESRHLALDGAASRLRLVIATRRSTGATG